MLTTIDINQHRIPVKNLQKVFWPEDSFSKGDLMNYYAAVWPFLAPHLYNRPVSLVRYPEGIHGQFFYQKNVPDPPAWVQTVSIASEERNIDYAMVNNLETLIWAINLGCIEVHPWLATVPALDQPTYIIVDLDPMEPATFEMAANVAYFFHLLLKELSLIAFPKISGATGLHLYIPLKPIYRFDQTSTFVKRIGEIIIRAHPDLATNERSVSRRTGKVYIDHLQNLRGKTIASVYSVRPFQGAPVSIPVLWEELTTIKPGTYTLKNTLSRLREKGDLFEPLLKLEQELPKELLE